MLFNQEQSEKRRAYFYYKNVKRLKLPLIENLCERNSPNNVIEFVLAPLMFSFTLWVVQQAKEKGIKKLYFLARDAYPAFVIAQKVCEEYSLDIECKYFYCSRYSLRVPMYSENLDDTLNHVCRSGIDVTFRKIMIRSGFSGDDIKRLEKFFDDIDFDSIIPYSKLIEVKDRLLKSKDYIDLLLENSRKKWEPLVSYFKENGMLAGKKIAVVDSGWTGTTQKSINDIRKRCNVDTPVEGFYFGLFEVPKECEMNLYHTYYFGPKTGFIDKVFFSNCLFEVLFHANHGTTMGYTIKTETEPILAEYQSSDLINEINDIIQMYTQKIVKNKNVNLVTIDIVKDRKLISKSLKKFMWNPTRAEADYFGQLKFSDNLLDESLREVGPVLPEAYLKENHFINKLLTAYGFRKKHIHESAWYEASVVRLGHHSLRHRCSYSIYKGLSYLKKNI